LDNLTHTLTGLMLARAGLARLTPGATAIAILAANLPDIDAVSAVHGSAVYLEHHRGPTHGLLLIPAMALLPVAVVWPFVRSRLQWRGAYGVSVIALLSHLLMDWTNIYGIRLLAPYSERWYRLDITSVVDPWILLVLIVCSLWPLLSRLVSGEIGARTRPGYGLARFALALILLYEGGRFLIHQRAVETLEARMHAGRLPFRVAAFPHLANPLRWTGLAEIDTAYVLHDVRLSGAFDPDAGRVFYKTAHSPQLEAAKNTAAFRSFLLFSQFPLWRVLPVAEPQGGHQVEASDLRFGLPGEGRFAAVCILDTDGMPLRSWFQFGPPGLPPRPR